MGDVQRIDCDNRVRCLNSKKSAGSMYLLAVMRFGLSLPVAISYRSRDVGRRLALTRRKSPLWEQFHLSWAYRLAARAESS